MTEDAWSLEETPLNQTMASSTEVEDVAMLIAVAVGSRVFMAFHDTAEHQAVRDKFRDLAETAIALTF